MTAQETVQIPEILHKMWGQMTRPISMGCTISLDTLRNHYVTLARGSLPQCSFNPSSFQAAGQARSTRAEQPHQRSVIFDQSAIASMGMRGRGMGHERTGTGQTAREGQGSVGCSVGFGIGLGSDRCISGAVHGRLAINPGVLRVSETSTHPSEGREPR